MVVSTAPPQIVWDAFLTDDALRTHIEGFRKNEWPSIRKHLAAFYGIDVSDEEEPHWIEPSRVVYWALESGHWRPTAAGLPAGNAQQIANYLKKGFRLRPPSEAALEYEGTLKMVIPTAEPELKYQCTGRGMRRKHKVITFRNHKLYLRHCDFFKEEPTGPVEAVVAAEREEQYKYFCAIHQEGFDHQLKAYRHLKGGCKNYAKVAEMRGNK